MEIATNSKKKELLKKEIVERLAGRIPLNVLEKVADNLRIDITDVYEDKARIRLG